MWLYPWYLSTPVWNASIFARFFSSFLGTESWQDDKQKLRVSFCELSDPNAVVAMVLGQRMYPITKHTSEWKWHYVQVSACLYDHPQLLCHNSLASIPCFSWLVDPLTPAHSPQTSATSIIVRIKCCLANSSWRTVSIDRNVMKSDPRRSGVCLIELTIQWTSGVFSSIDAESWRTRTVNVRNDVVMSW